MKRKLIAFVILATSSCGYAATKDVTMNLVDSDGKERNIGKITIQKTPYGLLFTPDLHSLPAGHAGGDNHDDHPEPLGGGGARIACGIIP
ncbi:hypothetical protein MZT66_26250 [Escherichia coli]|uniref:hypothetical protein n=1 Tax=Escherichia coli TaxID=562 RepID=UPI0034588B79